MTCPHWRDSWITLRKPTCSKLDSLSRYLQSDNKSKVYSCRPQYLKIQAAGKNLWSLLTTESTAKGSLVRRACQLLTCYGHKFIILSAQDFVWSDHPESVSLSWSFDQMTVHRKEVMKLLASAWGKLTNAGTISLRNFIQSNSCLQACCTLLILSHQVGENI